MTQDEEFKAWWYREGSQAPYTHQDCEEHTMRMCEIAWSNGAYKALAQEQEPDVQETLHCHAFNYRQAHTAQGNEMWLALEQFFESKTKHPPQRTWVDLPHEDILDLFDEHNVYGSKWLEFARAVEAKLRSKNT